MGFLDSLFQMVGNLFGGGGSNSSMTGGSQAGPGQMAGSAMRGGAQMAPGGGGAGGMMNPMSLMGMGLMGGSQLFGGKTSAPNLNTPQVQAMQQFTTNPPVLPQSMQDEINKSMGIQQEQESRNLRDVYKNARPGTDYTTDSAYQRDLANLGRQQTSDRANALIAPTLQYQQPLQENLTNQANMSMYQPMMQAGLQSQQQKQTKDLWSGIGGTLLNKGLWPNGMMGGAGGGGGNFLSSMFGGN